VASLRSSVPFGALLTYSPRGTSEVSVRSRQVRDAIKAARADVLERCVERLRELGGLAPFLGPEVVLVPAPRSAPIRDPGTLWPAERICARLLVAGLGREVLPCLRRTQAVPKSAFAGTGQRPTANLHHETMEARPSLVRPERITVVDDIITKGATLLAAVTRVAEAFPGADVRAFALLRTMGLVENVDRIVEACQGTIRWTGSEVQRSP
jgi:hypothetical protein